MAISDQRDPKSSERGSGCLAEVIRLSWLFIGNIALIFCAVSIALRKSPFLLDMIFAAIVFGLVVIRYIDIKIFCGETSDGAPATMSHWRRYAIIVIAAGGLLYAAAKAVAYFHLV